jgi:hypothetical protein
MGMVYKPKYKDKNGQSRQSAIWWIKYYRNGIPMRESSESEKESDAKKLLKQREGDVVRGAPVVPNAGRVRFFELAEDLVNNKVNGRRCSAI